MRCAGCGFENPEEMNFCIECAAPLKHRCPSCGFESPPQTKFCGKCATALTGRQKAKKPSSVQIKQKTKGKTEGEKRERAKEQKGNKVEGQQALRTLDA